MVNWSSIPTTSTINATGHRPWRRMWTAKVGDSATALRRVKMEVGFSRTDKSGGLPISSIYNYYIKANIAMKKYPICSMVLEYLSPFVLKKSPKCRWIYQHHGAYGYTRTIHVNFLTFLSKLRYPPSNWRVKPRFFGLTVDALPSKNILSSWNGSFHHFQKVP